MSKELTLEDLKRAKQILVENQRPLDKDGCIHLTEDEVIALYCFFSGILPPWVRDDKNED